MKNKFTVLSAFLFLLNTNTHSQTRYLSVGDKCPDILIQNIINYKVKEAKISDFRGKLLILDFWATWCSPCVSMMPVTDSLQNKFAGSIQILPVTDQNTSKVTIFLKSLYHYKNIVIPSATADTALRNIFPHTIVPHYVWINQNGVVSAITGATEVTANNIRKALEGNVFSQETKKDLSKTVDEKQPFFAIGNNVKDNDGSHFEKIDSSASLYHSVITKYIQGFSSESSTLADKLECKNNGMAGLFRFAAGHGKLVNLFMNSTIWEVNNPAVKPFNDSTCIEMERESRVNEWLQNYTYCYELKFPASLGDKKFDIMLADLNNYFGSLYNIECHMEKRKTKCLSLVQVVSNGSLASKTETPTFTYDQYHLKLTKQPMSLLPEVLAMNLDLYPPIVNTTNYSGDIDIDLNCNLQDLSSVNTALRSYGLELQETETMRDMVIIKDKL